MGAAIGWLQRNSSRSEEGRASWPWRRVNSSRSSEGRVLGPRVGWLQRAVAQWLFADSGAASAFQRMLVHDGFQMLSGLSDVPALVHGTCSCRSATEHRINNAHLVLHPIWNDELGSEKEIQKGHKHRARLEGTPGQIVSVTDVRFAPRILQAGVQTGRCLGSLLVWRSCSRVLHCSWWQV